MSDGQYRQLFEDGWKAYQDERWGDLEALLHEEIVWHEFHDEVTTGDHQGKAKAMEHFRECKSAYGDPSDRTYHVLHGDHAIVTDQVAGEPHLCTDMYRVHDNLIREMWTCVTHAPERAKGGSGQA
jgi:predicted SnoaL-like aldol condensation-catalyzing enzyme